MAVKTVKKGAPASKLVTPIPKPTSVGVQEKEYRAQLVGRSSGIKVPKTESDNGYGTGSAVGGATPLNGASV